MNLALRELLRRPGRFGAAGAVVFLISGLLMFLGGLSDGLNSNNDGALRSQATDLVVFSATADTSLPQSLVDGSAREQIAAVDGVEAVGGLSLVQLAARTPDAGPRDLLDVAVFSYEVPFKDLPAQLPPGRAWADSSLDELGLDVGMTITVGPARTPVTIEGFLSRTGYAAQGTLWVSPATFGDIVTQNRPDVALPPGAADVVVVALAEGADATTVAAAIDAATGTTATVTTAAAADAIPLIDGGVLQQIVAMTVVVAIAVIALFFALLTNERTGLYGVLKAIGASTSTIFTGVVAQAIALVAVSGVLAAALALLFDALIPPGEVPFELTSSRLLTSAVLLLVAAIAGAVFSLRRVVRIEPASAIGSAS